ncbi:MAG: DUF6382 domain-containing protein [Eubacteriales bacterium]|nr:DUF6382 domain-containing protein [Eubacteriales bacterium]
MKSEYKRDMNHNFLILYGEKEVDTASYQVRMLVGNIIPSLLKCRIQGIDGKFMVYYDITSKQSVSSFYEQRKFGMDDLRLLFGGFIQAMEEMSEYLMNPGQLVIRPEYIFLDFEKREIFFCCLPGFERDVREQFQELTEYILPQLDHEDEKAVMLGYGVYRRALEDSFHLEHIKEELYQVKETKEDNSKSNKENKETEGCIYVSGEMGGDDEQSGGEGEASLWRDDSRQEYFEKSSGTHSANNRIPGTWKKILGGIAGVIILMAILAAKAMGFVPGIGMEVILGFLLAAMGTGMLGYKVYMRIKENTLVSKGKEMHRKQSAQPKSREKKNPPLKRQNVSVSLDMKPPVWSRMEAGKEEVSAAKTLKGDVRRTGKGKIDDPKLSKPKTMASASQTLGTGWQNLDEGVTDEQEVFGIQRGKDVKRDKYSHVENYGETVVLSASPISGPASLVSREPGELATIYLQEEMTIIGKLEIAADAVINLPTVSRVHARIRNREGEYYLSDLNSRNGTSVNGRMLKGEEEYQLQDQDEVDFAQARYVFIK